MLIFADAASRYCLGVCFLCFEIELCVYATVRMPNITWCDSEQPSRYTKVTIYTEMIVLVCMVRPHDLVMACRVASCFRALVFAVTSPNVSCRASVSSFPRLSNANCAQIEITAFVIQLCFLHTTQYPLLRCDKLHSRARFAFYPCPLVMFCSRNTEYRIIECRSVVINVWFGGSSRQNISRFSRRQHPWCNSVSVLYYYFE